MSKKQTEPETQSYEMTPLEFDEMQRARDFLQAMMNIRRLNDDDCIFSVVVRQFMNENKEIRFRIFIKASESIPFKKPLEDYEVPDEAEGGGHPLPAPEALKSKTHFYIG